MDERIQKIRMRVLKTVEKRDFDKMTMTELAQMVSMLWTLNAAALTEGFCCAQRREGE